LWLIVVIQNMYRKDLKHFNIYEDPNEVDEDYSDEDDFNEI